MLPIWPDCFMIKETMPGVLTSAIQIQQIFWMHLKLMYHHHYCYNPKRTPPTRLPTPSRVLANKSSRTCDFCLFTLHGSISDTELIECSGFLSLLKRGDEVMADWGFTVDELLAHLMLA